MSSPQYKQLWEFFFLKKLGFLYIYTNHSIFILLTSLNGPIVSMFINDIKIIDIKSSKCIIRVKLELIAEFLIVDLGPLCLYLDLKVERNKKKR